MKLLINNYIFRDAEFIWREQERSDFALAVAKLEWTFRAIAAATVVGKINSAILLFPREILTCIVYL